MKSIAFKIVFSKSWIDALYFITATLVTFSRKITIPWQMVLHWGRSKLSIAMNNEKVVLLLCLFLRTTKFCPGMSRMSFWHETSMCTKHPMVSLPNVIFVAPLSCRWEFANVDSVISKVLVFLWGQDNKHILWISVTFPNSQNNWGLHFHTFPFPVTIWPSVFTAKTCTPNLSCLQNCRDFKNK